MSKCDLSSEKFRKLLIHPGSEHSNTSFAQSHETELSVVVSLHLYTRVSCIYNRKTLHLQRGKCSLGSVIQAIEKEPPYRGPLRKTSRHECPFPQTGCCVVCWILLSCFTSKVLLVSSTTQTHADVPFTGLSESALLMSAAVRISCPSLQYRRMHVFIGHKIRSHTSLPCCGSEWS